MWVAGATAQALGVTCEAIYVGLRVQPVLAQQVRYAPAAAPLTLKAFSQFYIPLALTSLMTFIWQPIGSAGISRMPAPIDSLAIWPVVTGLTFMLRSLGIALNEVVVALLDRPGSFRNLQRFTGYLASFLGILSVLIAVTPLSLLWFNRVSGLSLPLSGIARIGFLLSIPMASLATYQSWYQGLILHGRNTRGIPESVAIFLGTAVILLAAGVVWGGNHRGLCWRRGVYSGQSGTNCLAAISQPAGTAQWFANGMKKFFGRDCLRIDRAAARVDELKRLFLNFIQYIFTLFTLKSPAAYQEASILR